MPAEKLNVVVTGAAGRLGGAIARELFQAGHHVAALNRANLDITDATLVRETIGRLAPDVIVNCTAYNAVDAAEADPSTAFAVNAYGPGALADAALETGAILIHYSTDFVFDGRGSTPYTEDAPTNPLSVYGASKLAGECEVRRVSRHYILRVESLFGGFAVTGQRSTIDYMIETLAGGGHVRALVDRTVSPSYVPDVVRATIALLGKSAAFGTYHCVTSGFATWYELAKELAAYLRIAEAVLPSKSTELKAIAERPRFCALSNQKLRDSGVTLPGWRDALIDHLGDRLVEVGATSHLRARIA